MLQQSEKIDRTQKTAENQGCDKEVLPFLYRPQRQIPLAEKSRERGGKPIIDRAQTVIVAPVTGISRYTCPMAGVLWIPYLNFSAPEV